MREHFQWGDTDGNNGYGYNGFTSSELQAAWELQGMPYIYWNEDPGSRTGRLEVSLASGGEPQVGLFPNKIDAKTIQAAIEIRAKLIEEEGELNPPTIEQIRARILEKRTITKADDLRVRIQAVLDRQP